MNIYSWQAVLRTPHEKVHPVLHIASIIICTHQIFVNNSNIFGSVTLGIFVIRNSKGNGHGQTKYSSGHLIPVHIFHSVMYFLTLFIKEYDKIFSSFVRIFNTSLSILIICSFMTSPFFKTIPFIFFCSQG
jgi:hypothetical protein